MSRPDDGMIDPTITGCLTNPPKNVVNWLRGIRSPDRRAIALTVEVGMDVLIAFKACAFAEARTFMQGTSLASPAKAPMTTTPAPALVDRSFVLLFVVMLVIGAGNTALQSVMPAIGRSLKISDALIAIAFSASGALWVFAAPWWAKRSDRLGHKRMVLTGIIGFAISMTLCGVMLTIGLRGLIVPAVTIFMFMPARAIYGFFGAAAPPAAQAILVAKTPIEERTRVLTLLASAFGLGTILGPMLATFMVLPGVGLAGPPYVYAVIACAVAVIVWRQLRVDPGAQQRGAAQSYPSIGNGPSGGSVRAATGVPSLSDVKLFDPRVAPWMIAGLVAGHAQAMTGQAIGFLVMDRLHLAPLVAHQLIGIVLTSGAGASLLVQWGLIPMLGLRPRALLIVGLSLSAVGCVFVAGAQSIAGIASAFALTSAGFGFSRPGYTAGSSLAVGPELQTAVAGKVTSVNGAAFVLGPSIGVAMYEAWGPTPYLVAAVLCAGLALWLKARLPSDRAAEASPA